MLQIGGLVVLFVCVFGGFIMSGGMATRTRHFRLVLNQPSVRTADQIVRLVNTRFPECATGARDPGYVDLAVPKEYQDDKLHFLDLIGAIYLRETPDSRDLRLKLLAQTLESGKDMDAAALCLEAFGGASLPHLKRLAESPDLAVRFYVGRTLAALGDAQSVIVLEPIAMDDKSDFQEMAVEALGKLHSGLGMGVLSRTLDAKSARVRIAAWKAMAHLQPRMFMVHSYRDRFRLNVVNSRADPFIYIATTETCEVTLFGAVKIRPPVLAETRRVTATAAEGATTMTVITRAHGKDFRVETPLDVRGFIEKTAAAADLEKNDGRPQGLELDYSDIVSLLYRMSQRQALSGPIVLQPLKYRLSGDRPTARPIGEPSGSDIDVEDLAPPESKSKSK